MTLFSSFKIRKFGPIFSLQLIACYETLMKVVDQWCVQVLIPQELIKVDFNSIDFMMQVDKAAKWARWRNASNLIQEVDVDTIPSEASRKFEGLRVQ